MSFRVPVLTEVKLVEFPSNITGDTAVLKLDQKEGCELECLELLLASFFRLTDCRTQCVRA